MYNEDRPDIAEALPKFTIELQEEPIWLAPGFDCTLNTTHDNFDLITGDIDMKGEPLIAGHNGVFLIRMTAKITDGTMLRYYNGYIDHKVGPILMMYKNPDSDEIDVNALAPMNVVQFMLDSIDESELENIPDRELLTSLKNYLDANIPTKLTREEGRRKMRYAQRGAYSLVNQMGLILTQLDIPSSNPRYRAMKTKKLIEAENPIILSFTINRAAYAAHMEAVDKEKVQRTLLLGAASAPSAEEYRKFVEQDVNRNAQALVLDINEPTVSTFNPTEKSTAFAASALELPLPNDSVDIVFTNHLMHQLVQTPIETKDPGEVGEQRKEHIRRMMAEAYRVLSPDGVLSLQEIYDGNLRSSGFADIHSFAQFVGDSLVEVGFSDVSITNSERLQLRDAYESSTTMFDALSVFARKH